MTAWDNDRHTVFVVDDDEAVCDALGMLLRAAGLRVETFCSASLFLKAYRPGSSACLILDIRMPGMSGLDLKDELYKPESTGIYFNFRQICPIDFIGPQRWVMPESHIGAVSTQACG